MVLLGISILIASVSFLCFRYPPSSWSTRSFLSWLICPSIRDVAKEIDAPAPTHNPERSPASEKESGMLMEEAKDPVVTFTEVPSPSKQDADRKAMPPPPPPLKKPNSKPLSPPTTPRASDNNTTPTLPTFTLENSHDGKDEEGDRMPPPSFPALNSAQRASDGPRGPPRLNPLPTQQSISSASRQGLMAPPPTRSPLPNRSPLSPSTSTTSSSLSPPPTHTTIPSKPRKKVLLTPGHSPLDWASLTSSPSTNLRNLPPSTPYLKVPPSLLKTYNGRPTKPPSFNSSGNRIKNDAWTVLGGKVYNITPYLPYHPGGEPELLKAAGKDGTKLFGEVHPWVNWEGMLEACLIGVAVGEEEVTRKVAELEEMD